MKSTLPRVRPTRPRSGGLVVAALDPLAWALLLAGVFDGLSDNWLHAVVLLAAAVAVWRDTWYRAAGRTNGPSRPLLRARDPDRARRWTPVVLGAVIVIAYGGAVGAFERYTWPGTVAVLAPAAVVLVIGWRGPLRPRPVPRPLARRSVRLWSVVLVAGGLWELAALLLQPSLQVSSQAHPTISTLMDSVLASPAGRTVTVVAWLALGWWLLAQVPGDDPREPTDDLA